MSKFVWILDAGHGGVINGVPQTAGKRSPNWEKGILYEGVINRLIVDKVFCMCQNQGISAIKLVENDKDIPLSERVKKVNSIHRATGKANLISVHCDAFTKESANGWSAFTSYGKTKSDKIATELYKKAKDYKFKLRTDGSDGDPDKEAGFYVLRKTNCPAVLVENLFMTNKEDYEVLMSEEGREKLARVIFRAIKNIEKNGL